MCDMSKDNIICENCGENTDSVIYDCEDCSNHLCDECSNVCKRCGAYLCDSCYQDHKKNCKK